MLPRNGTWGGVAMLTLVRRTLSVEELSAYKTKAFVKGTFLRKRCGCTLQRDALGRPSPQAVWSDLSTALASIHYGPTVKDLAMELFRVGESQQCALQWTALV